MGTHLRKLVSSIPVKITVTGSHNLATGSLIGSASTVPPALASNTTKKDTVFCSRHSENGWLKLSADTIILLASTMEMLHSEYEMQDSSGAMGPSTSVRRAPLSMAACGRAPNCAARLSP